MAQEPAGRRGHAWPLTVFILGVLIRRPLVTGVWVRITLVRVVTEAFVT
jgi:hypothetical protein